MSTNTLSINSESNSQYRVWKSLLTAKGIKENQLFLFSGKKLIEEFLNKPNLKYKIEYVLLNAEQEPLLKCIPKLSAKHTILANHLFKELDTLGTHFPILVLSFNPFEQKSLQNPPAGLEIISPLGDPKNLGALCRSALGFGVSEIILTQESCHPFLPQTVKASAGAVINLNFSTTFRLSEITSIGENYALDLKGTALNKITWPKNLRLWVGEEGPGLNLTSEQKKNIKFITVPTKNIESLNAMVSATLAIWEWSKNVSN